jgi:integrin beta 8
MPTMAIKTEDVGQHISRCNVCEAPSTVLAVHSQTAEIPECPIGFDTMWMGYSFLAHTSEGADGGGQDMGSPGSCLEDFRATPFIECTGARGTCQFFANSFSFWVRTINADQQFADPQLQALKGKMDGRSQVSRCKVCVKSL